MKGLAAWLHRGMSRKVKFYMMLDVIGVGITLLVRMLLCHFIQLIPEPWVQIGLSIMLNIVSIAICLFIVFFFFLYWWSDRKWTNIKSKFRKRK